VSGIRTSASPLNAALPPIGQTRSEQSPWPTAPLGDLCEIIGGGTPSKANPSFYAGNIPWATVRDMKMDIIETTECSITLDAVRSSATNIIPGGNVIIATRVGLGKVCLLAQDTAINQDLRGIIPRDSSLKVRFVYHWLRYVAPQIIQEGTGATVQGVKLPFIKSLMIPVPTPRDQERLVAILDEAFEGIAASRAKTERNLQNTRVLFESYLHFSLTRGSENWAKQRLEGVVDSTCTLSYGIVQPGEELLDGLPIVRPTDLTTKVIQLNGLKRIDPKLAESYRRTQLRGGEILLCVRGTTGTISIASSELAGANVTRGVVPIRFDESRVIQEFGYYLMKGGQLQEQVKEKTYGSALMQVNICDLRNIMLSFPSVDEQKEIADKLDVLSTKMQRLVSAYQRKLGALEALKQSILHQAFTGKL